MGTEGGDTEEGGGLVRPWSSALLSLSIYPAVEKSPWNISRGPSIPKNLGPWENKQCLATAWLRALGDSEMSLAILARLICWETGLQTHRARPACLGTTEVWVLRGATFCYCRPLHSSMAASSARPGPRPRTEVTSKCPVECHSGPALLALSRALHRNSSPLNIARPSMPLTHSP